MERSPNVYALLFVSLNLSLTHGFNPQITAREMVSLPTIWETHQFTPIEGQHCSLRRCKKRVYVVHCFVGADNNPLVKHSCKSDGHPKLVHEFMIKLRAAMNPVPKPFFEWLRERKNKRYTLLDSFQISQLRKVKTAKRRPTSLLKRLFISRKDMDTDEREDIVAETTSV